MDEQQAPPAPDSELPDKQPEAESETDEQPVIVTSDHSEHHTRRWLNIGGLILIIIAAAFTWWLLHKPAVKPLAPATKQSVTTKQTPDKPTGTVLDTTPTKISPINLFTDYGAVFGYDCTSTPNITDPSKCPPSDTLNDLSFYQIGKTGAGQPIIAVETPRNIDQVTYIVVQDAANHYTIYGVYTSLGTGPQVGTYDASSRATNIASFEKSLASNVTLNTTDFLPNLSLPVSTNIKGLSLSLPGGNQGSGFFINGLNDIRGSYYNMSVSNQDMKLLGSTGSVNFYEVTVNDKPNFQLREIDAAIGGAYASFYQLNDPLSNNQTAPAIKWTDGTSGSNTNTYLGRTPGCGSAYGYVIVKNLDPSSLTAVGTGPDGQTVYELPSNNPLLQELYTTDYDSGTSLDNNNLKNLTLAQFQKAHAVLVAKNPLGDYAAYLRDDIFVGGGCGKPVIYLYPTHTTSVNVQVGAEITQSDPLYQPGSGWQNVIARPDGQLSYQDKSYNSLFWEGFGLGVYPTVNSGTVVSQNNLISTIKHQLAEQGLNGHEISDFVSFWQPRLPKSPYIRLTWFSTQQMNQLAPLNVSPAPQTVIRTFLDFQGLNAPIKLTPQTFHAPPRTGFTLVEWGGWLRNQ